MFSIFRKYPCFEFSKLSVDVHSHLLPGIDDGAKNIDESIAMIKALDNLGFKKLITTPHIMRDYYENTPELIRSKRGELLTALDQHNLNIEIEVGAEYFVDIDFENRIDDNQPLLSFSDNYLLIEFSMMAPPSNAESVIFKLRTKGFTPILAHPERYLYYKDAFEFFEKLKSMGCLLQLNWLSLTGYYGVPQTQMALRLLKKSLIDFIGSDLHHIQQMPFISQLEKRNKINKVIANYPFKNRIL